MITDCRIIKTARGRWIVTHAHSNGLAWTGGHWELVDAQTGIPFGRFQVNNFGSEEEAMHYAKEMGLKVLPTERGGCPQPASEVHSADHAALRRSRDRRVPV